MSLPAQPQQPVIPNAAEDPFGAMNALAAVGKVQRAPEIVIVNDGKPVENVGSSALGTTIAKLAIPAVAMLVIGVAVGSIGSSASRYNAGLADVRAVLGDSNKPGPSTVLLLKSQLSEIDKLLDEWQKLDWRPNSALDKRLEAAAARLAVKSDVFFRAKQNALDAELSGKILSFYAGVAEVRGIVDNHIVAAKNDDLAFKRNKEAGDAAALKETDNAALAGELRYAVLVQAPTETDGAPFGARIVELGPPYCGAAAANPTTSGKCPDNERPSGYAYRAEPGAMWTRGDLAADSTDTVPTKKLVRLLPGGVRDSLVKGADGVASEVYYTKRLRLLYERVHGKPGKDGKPIGGLLDEGNKLGQAMQTEASKSKRFSFFM